MLGLRDNIQEQLEYCCNSYQKMYLENENKYFRILSREYAVLFRVIVLRIMSVRPKRSVGKVDYKDLADIKLPKRSRVTCRSKASLSASSDQSVLYRLKILERNEDRVKVRYIGYGSK